LGRGSGVNGIGDVLMNKSTLEKQTGLRAYYAGNMFYLGDVISADRDRVYFLNGGYISKQYSQSKGWQDLFDQWWRDRKIAVFERDGYRCVMCLSPRNIECDHIVNRSQGGDSSMENLQTLCHTCHEKKTNNVS